MVHVIPPTYDSFLQSSDRIPNATCLHFWHIFHRYVYYWWVSRRTNWWHEPPRKCRSEEVIYIAISVDFFALVDHIHLLAGKDKWACQLSSEHSITVMTSASKFHERTCEYSSEIFIDVINNRLGLGNVPSPHLPSGFCAAGLGTCVEVYTPSWCSQSTAL